MNILLTGGAGYVGSLLTPALLDAGHDVTVLDTFWYGDPLKSHPRLGKMQADIRTVKPSLFKGIEAVIHLACISNDPSFELDAELGRSVNYDATVEIVRMAKEAGVSRFIYASSSSVYGVKPDGVDVTEDLPLEPLTDYSKYKAMGEDAVLKAQSKKFTTTVIRPATLCGYAPRLRLDLIVNILTAKAVFWQQIPVFGGSQHRPNLHVADMVRAYLAVLDAPAGVVAGQVFNVGAENATVLELAQRVQAICWGELVVTLTDDPRSYIVNSEKIKRVLGFTPAYSIEDAITQLRDALLSGQVPNAMTDPVYYNIKQMQTCHIS